MKKNFAYGLTFWSLVFLLLTSESFADMVVPPMDAYEPYRPGLRDTLLLIPLIAGILLFFRQKKRSHADDAVLPDRNDPE